MPWLAFSRRSLLWPFVALDLTILALFMYAAASSIYLPILIYSGYFNMPNLLPNMVKDILLDGTFYHLWYLPASVTGAMLAWYLVRRFRFKTAFSAAVFLYIIGLFGDSYFGISQRIPLLNIFYGHFFEVSDYTRNGIFFAPVFFILGGLLADMDYILSLMKSICGFVISFFLMLAEALILRNFRLQRHDSMYVFLLPCVFFLFQILLRYRGKRVKNLRTVSLIIYLIHPMVIAGLRLFAKLFHIQKVLTENSLIHFAAVGGLSVLIGMCMTTFWNKYRNVYQKSSRSTFRAETERAFIELDLENLRHNARVLQNRMPEKCDLMAVVKANAYGHGDYEVSVCLNRIGVRAFAVATVEEGIRLRKYGIRGEILILGYTDVRRVFDLKKYDLTQTLIDFDYAKALNEQRVKVKAHIKTDTGMHRIGIDYKNISDIKAIFSMKYIKVCGIFTHLCCADSLKPEDISYTENQIANFGYVTDALRYSNIEIPKIHMQSSYGFLNYPNPVCDYVRVGIALYGVLSLPNDDTVLKPDLKPVLSLKSRIILLRNVGKGESIGYGRSIITDRDSRIAVVPVGYGDGFPRILSEREAGVSVNGIYAPIVGRICMDQLTVDVTDVPNVKVGDEVRLIGYDINQKTAAPDLADKADSISNELLCRLGARLPVVVTGRL